MQEKFPWDKVMYPFLQGLNYGLKLLIIRGVFYLGLIQILIEIGNMSIILAQNYSNCNSTCITSHLKCLFKIQQDHNWSFYYFLLQYIEAPLSLLYPFKRLVLLLYCIHHWCKNSTEVFDELPIETHQSMEASYFKHTPW
jgi:hypothetical protein